MEIEEEDEQLLPNIIITKTASKASLVDGEFDEQVEYDIQDKKVSKLSEPQIRKSKVTRKASHDVGILQKNVLKGNPKFAKKRRSEVLGK